MSHSTTAAHVGPDGDVVLVVIAEGGTFIVPLVPGKDVVLGRADDCEVSIEDASVSRKHTAIGGEPLRVEDLGSRNGTRLFGQRLEPGKPVPLPVGASLELGSVTVLVQRGGGPLAELFSSSSTATSAAAPKELPRSFVAVDARTLRVVRLAELVAERPIHLTILGEAGVGKETLARFVHERSTRSSAPFVRVACGPAVDDAALSEAWKSAAGGTVYLDGIETLSDAVQAELARRIEATDPNDVRVIAALAAEHVKDGAAPARVDLLRSVSGFTLRMPRLRDRIADIKPLAEHFANVSAAKNGAQPPEISRRAVARLEAHAWPLNVAELSRVIDGAVLASAGGPIEEEHVEALGVAGSRTEDASRGELRDAVEEVERRRVLDALAEAGGNQTLAAKKLGIARGTLIARLQAYGIARPRKSKTP